MHLVEFDKQFMLGLFLFVRMLHLSLDRAIGGGWNNFVNYMTAQPNLRSVSIALSKRSGYQFPPARAPSKPATDSRLLSDSKSKVPMLDRAELNFISWWLERADKLINGESSPPPLDEIIEVRLNLAYAQELIRSRLGTQDRSIESGSRSDHPPAIA